MNGYIFVNGVEIYKINTKNSGINAAALCLSNISKYFPADIIKKSGLSGFVFDFSIDFDNIDVDDI